MIGGWDRDTEQLITSLHDLSQVASQLDSQRVTADASYAASWQVDKYLDYRISSIIPPPLPTYLLPTHTRWLDWSRAIALASKQSNLSSLVLSSRAVPGPLWLNTYLCFNRACVIRSEKLLL